MLPELTLFLDENIHNSQVLLSALQEMKIRFERHGAHFQAGLPDTEWLPLLRDRGWHVLTADKRIRYRPLERDAVRVSAIGMFCFTQHGGAARMAKSLRAAVPRMRRIAERQPAPFIALIADSGHVEVRESFGAEIVPLR